MHSQTRAVPRLVLCSETTRISRKLLTVLRVGLKGVRLDLLCEHAEQPHVVSGAPGCEINQKVAGERWTNLQPFLAAGLQIVTLAVNSASGMGAVLPNLHQMVKPISVAWIRKIFCFQYPSLMLRLKWLIKLVGTIFSCRSTPCVSLADRSYGEESHIGGWSDFYVYQFPRDHLPLKSILSLLSQFRKSFLV